MSRSRADDLIAQADAVCKAINRIGATAETEEDVRINVDAALRPIMTELNLRTEPRFEQGVQRGALASGRADAIYGAVYIEYKRPGRLENATARAEAIRQIEDYLEGASLNGDGQASRRLVGVVLDGRLIIFVRARGPRSSALDYYHRSNATVEPGSPWSVTEPLPIIRESVGQLLHYLRALDRSPLTAEALARVFGPQGELGPRLVGGLYRRLLASSDPLVDTLFREWDRIFGIVYGQDTPRAAGSAKELGSLYGVAKPDLKRLFFAVHTYYALIMKLLAIEVASLQKGSYITSFVEEVEGLDDAAFDRKLTALEDGSEFRQLEITNYLEGDFFRWYLSAWDDELRGLVRECVRALEGFEPSSAAIQPELARDILKHLYQYLVPKALRHDLGEYYTPDWLAEFLLEEAGYTGDPAARVLDPACGSGTFLALAIARVLAYADEHLLPERDVARQIVRNVVGFDLNPLAVLAARTTYLLSLGHFLRYVRPLEIPVYLCDSILLPKPQGGGLLSQGRELTTSAARFIVPGAVDDPAKMSRFAEALERAVRGHHDEAGLLQTVERTVVPLEPDDRELLAELYGKLRDLDMQGRNGIWARIIKNGFAHVYVSSDRFDFVIGNPPWVNWESLSDEYRRATLPLWREWGLFSLKGHEARLGGGKKDLSMLMLYGSALQYLRPHGVLAFLVTATLFKTAGAGAGFRRLTLGDSTGLGVRVVHDMSALQPFEGATNRTAAIVLERDVDTTYPVSWVQWASLGRRPRTDASLAEVLAHTTRQKLVAQPVERGDRTSSWLTAAAGDVADLRRAAGASAYRAWEGCNTGGLNGAYWLEVLARRTDGALLIRNLHDVGRIPVEPVETTVEPDLIFPLLRGRDVQRWRTQPSAWIVLAQDPQTRVGYDTHWLRERLPLTFEYLARFEAQLRARAAFRKYYEPSDPFYSMYNVGPNTVAPWKVVWREQATSMTTAVCGPIDGRPVIPDHKLMSVPVETDAEADFLCAVLNSQPVAAIVAGYTVSVSISTHVLEHVRIPRYDPANELHHEIAEVGRLARETGAADEAALERLVSRLWSPS
jgi:SAM-dependent methyltransferase